MKYLESFGDFQPDAYSFNGGSTQITSFSQQYPNSIAGTSDRELDAYPDKVRNVRGIRRVMDDLKELPRKKRKRRKKKDA